MHAKLLTLALCCLLFATGCDENSPTGPTVGLNQEFVLAPGEIATIQDTSVRIQFLRVTGDSRCPADVVCIQGGDAIVHIRASNGGAEEFELHTGDDARAVIPYSGVRIALINLQPYPFSSRTIEPGDYRASLRVTR